MRSVAPGAPRLARGVRFTAIFCLLFSGLTGLFAASEAMALARFSELKEASAAPGAQWLGDPALAKRVLDARFAALEPMREQRTFVLGALSLACAFTFVAAVRLLRPGGLPREGMRRLVGGAALVAAVLRTVEGAQGAVVARRMGEAMAAGLTSLPQLTQPEELAQVKAALPSLMFASSVFQTFLVVGIFLALGHYFRSDKVREAVAEPSSRGG